MPPHQDASSTRVEEAGVSAPGSSEVLPTASPSPPPMGPVRDAGRDARIDAGTSRPSSSSVLDASVGAPASSDAGLGGSYTADASLVFDAGIVGGGAGGSSAADAGPRDAGGVQLAQAQIDLLAQESDELFFRLYGGPGGDGQLGVPVAAGDLDGDGLADLVMASFLGSPEARTGAGQVAVVFGSGSFRGTMDLGAAAAEVLWVYGAGNYEGTGSQLGIGDVDGDGQDDLLLCRQNYRADAPDRPGAGALSIVLGGSHLRELERAGGVLDLVAPPAEVRVLDFVGANAVDRLGIWVRTGDLTGDGVADVVVGADQEDGTDAADAGAVYVIRGGSHLATTQVVDFAAFGSSALNGHLAKIVPPSGADDYHFGATVHLGDLDRNGRADLVAAAALIRSGATYQADGAPGGSAVASAGAPPGGRAYVVWDDNFPNALWPPSYTIDLSQAPGPVTEILSSSRDLVTNQRLGEELLAGGDYDADGRPDLFVGDMIGNAAGRSNAGVGFVVFDAARLRSMSELTLLEPPAGLAVTTILGAFTGGIAADTVRYGDFDGDGVTDLAVASPNASPLERIQAGTVHVLWGGTQRWPAQVDLANLPGADEVQITVVQGARGGSGFDSGDMLAYSAEVFDVDGDGRDDLIANEMGGNGLQTGTLDVGNLLVLDGRLLSRGRPDCQGNLGGTAVFDPCGECGALGTETSCVRFDRDVLPILNGACPSCHGAAAGLSLFSYEQLMSGTSDNGPVVLPGDPEASLLVQKLADPAPFGDRMPVPPDPALSPDQIETIRAWILAGARDN